MFLFFPNSTTLAQSQHGTPWSQFAELYLRPCQAAIIRSSHQDVFLGKGVLKIYSKFTVEHPCQSMISIQLLCNLTEIELWHWCSPVNLLHIFRTPFPLDGCFCIIELFSKIGNGKKPKFTELGQSGNEDIRYPLVYYV